MVVKNMVSGAQYKGKGICNKAEIISCSNGKNALFLTISTSDDSFVAKQWDISNGVSVDMYTNKVIDIDGVINTYKGINEVKVYSAVPTDDDVSPYIRSLDLDSLASTFMNFLKTHIDDNYFEVLKVVFSSVSFEKFVRGYAATSHHDNISGGLINHTLKMLRIAEVVLTNLPELNFMKNRIYTGIVLHDIGKIDCYTSTGGVDTLNYVDHKALGIEKLAQLKLQIISHISEEEYYQLIAIILGHHGEFGEPCHSVATQIINLIDILESQTTNIVQLMSQINFTGEIKFDNRYLHI